MTDIIDNIVKIVFCHLLGDYVLQIDFIAKSKGDNFYHMLVHCVLYTLPFYIAFGLSWKLIVLFLMHVIVDTMKAKYKVIDYVQDQALHYIIAFMIYLVA